MVKDLHLALYGSKGLYRGYCTRCERYALILDGYIQCCDDHVEIDGECSTQKRMSSPTDKRGTASAKFRKQQLQEQDYRCIYCEQAFGSIVLYKRKVTSLQVRWDHRLPFAYSQDNQNSNFVAACQYCNGWKSSLIFQTIEEVRIYVQQKWEEQKAHSG